jgi:aubergine-like protein
VGNWACVFPEQERRMAQQVCQTMRQLAGQQGAQLGNVDVAEIPGNQTKDSKAWITAINSVTPKRPAFILFMNPNADSFVYSVVKNACTVQTAMVSQVMDSTKLGQNAKMLKPICGNTLKQILAKLGFQNWRIDIGKYLPPSEAKSTMFVGVDVSHDKLLKGVYGASRGRRSTVGFTASRNDTYHAFNSYISYQDPDTEFITEAKRLMTSALDDYFAENKRHPTSIVVYRDGVGDSQLTTFVRQEINLYKEAFEAKNLDIKLTVIVVQKRVNLRLFARCPLNARQVQRCPIEGRCNGRDAYHSPMAGTIVDNVITSEMMSDFYLVPSIAPPGATARPTRFVVMRDDMNLRSNPDNLQNMTNNMCYQYFNWPGPIRVPACVMYAHKAAYLFGKHVTGNPNAGLAKNLFYL